MKVRGILGLNLILPIVVVGLVLAGSAYLYNLRQQVVKANQATATAIAQRDAAALETQKAIAVARENSATIAALQAQAELANTAINDLQKAQASIKQQSAGREVIIQSQAKTKPSVSVAAPVVTAIIDQVQQDRIRRRTP